MHLTFSQAKRVRPAVPARVRAFVMQTVDGTIWLRDGRFIRVM